MNSFDVDEKQSLQRAIKLLKKYWRIKHIASSVVHLQSTTYSNTPKQASRSNTMENKVINAVEAKQTLDNIDFAISQLTEYHQRLLRLSYMNIEKLTAVHITMELNVSENTYRNHRKQALIEFAEAYPTGELLVFKG